MERNVCFNSVKKKTEFFGHKSSTTWKTVASNWSAIQEAGNLYCCVNSHNLLRSMFSFWTGTNLGHLAGVNRPSWEPFQVLPHVGHHGYIATPVEGTYWHWGKYSCELGDETLMVVKILEFSQKFYLTLFCSNSQYFAQLVVVLYCWTLSKIYIVNVM